MDMRPLRNIRRTVMRRILLTGLAVLPLCLTPATHGAMLYKNYVVRYDRGWDILCDPYQVQKGDWVLKIFRQKGEIAHEDFREFLGIFERLNPHVKDIDRIRPGQVVDIPLKKLAQGALPGQSSGVVTIPFVMVDNPKEMIQKNSNAYTIRRGDTVSKLIANHFGGRYGNLTYSQGLKLFKAVNPHIKNIDRIYAGEKIYLPDPSIREQGWYSGLFDESGNLAEEVVEAEMTSADATQPRPTAAPSTPIEQLPRQSESKGPIAEAASVMGGRLLNKGTYFLPMKQGSDFELDLSRYPMIDLGKGKKVILTSQDKVMNVDLPLIQSYWDDVKVVKVGENSSSREILEAVFAAFSDQQSANQIAFEDGGVTVRISAKWIRTEPTADNRAPRHTCITPVSNAAQRTNDAVIRYLDQHDIAVNEVLDDATSQAPLAYPIHRTGEATRIDGSSQKALIATFSQIMGFHYSANTAISFPYAGIQVKALSNLLSFGNGRETLVDFGDLYGDAVNAIRETGMEIIQIYVEDGPRDILRRLLEAAGMPFTANPVFYGADRPVEFNTAITIDGILIPIDDGRSPLFTELPIPELIGIFLRDKGIQLVQIKTAGS